MKRPGESAPGAVTSAERPHTMMDAALFLSLTVGEQQGVVTALLLLILVLLAADLMAPALAALLVPVALSLVGVVPPERAFLGFADRAVITIGALMVLGRAIHRTGALGVVGRRLTALAHRSERRFLLVLLATTAGFSAFVFNAPVVVVLLPILVGISRETNRPPSRFLMPVAFASILGGTLTRLGSSTNVLVTQAAEHLTGERMGLFTMTPAAVPLGLLGILFLVAASRKLLPDRATVGYAVRSLLDREYLTELLVPPVSPMVGRPLRQTLLRPYPRLILLEVLREEAMIVHDLPETVVRPGDILILKGDAQEIAAAMHALQLRLAPTRGDTSQELSREAVLAEVVIPYGSEAVGKTLRKAGMRRRLGMTVLAVKRKGKHQRHRIEELHLQPGDTLLAYGDRESVEALKQSNDYLLLERPHEIQLHERAPVALSLLVLFIVLASLHTADVASLAVAAAMGAVLTGCLEYEDAFKSVDWSVLVLVGGTLALGRALADTGTARLYAETLTGLVGTESALGLLGATFGLAAVLSNLISYNATAILMMPIAADTARAAALPPEPFFLAVLFGVACCFVTPMGHPVNALVFGAGGYRFSDYVRLGLPLALLTATAGTLLVWGLYF